MACRQGQAALAGFTIICVEVSDIEQFFRRKKARKPCQVAGLSATWWRCRELNPGPKILPSRIYMLSSE